ncbi:MAG: hypothetical protein HYV96_04675 [Opitutae bacterium]|nr:hypothetical protein [Opitutae bacterium]
MLASVDLSWLWSPKDYFYAIVSAVIGALLGILWAKLEFAAQQKKEAEKVRLGIIDTLKFNKERAEQANEQLKNGGMPNYPLDGARLSSLILPAHGLLSDELLLRVDWHRYQLDHITSKLAVVNGFFLSASVSTPDAKRAYDEWIAMLRQSLIEHYQKVINGTDALVADVEKKGKR